MPARAAWYACMPCASNADPRCCALKTVTSVAPRAARTTRMKIAAIAANPRAPACRSGNVADVHFMIEPDRLVGAGELEAHRHQAETLGQHERVIGDLARSDVLREQCRSGESAGGLRERNRVVGRTPQCARTVSRGVDRPGVADVGHGSGHDVESIAGRGERKLPL